MAPTADPAGAPSLPQGTGQATDGDPEPPQPTSLLRAAAPGQALAQAPPQSGGPGTLPAPHPQTTAHARADSPGLPGGSPPIGDRPETTERQSQDVTLGNPPEQVAPVDTQRSLEVRTRVAALGREPGPFIEHRNVSRLVTQHALESLLAAMANQRQTSLSFEAAGGRPPIPHSLQGFVEDVAWSFVLRPLAIRETKGSLDAYHLVGTDRLVLAPGPAGHVRTCSVFQGSVRVHHEGVAWPRASTLLYPADAQVPEISRDSGSPVLPVTTHPKNVST